MHCFNPLLGIKNEYYKQGSFIKPYKGYYKRILFLKDFLKNKKNVSNVEIYLRNGISDLLPCNNCFGCRAKKAMSWTIRNYFESQRFEHNIFCTLTYDDKIRECPVFLSKVDVQLFLKRLRINLVRSGYIEPIKYFCCGEYGGLHGRPHYHIIFFNLDLSKIDTLVLVRKESSYNVYTCNFLTDSWKLGMVEFSDLSIESVKYVSGYCQKKIKGTLSNGEIIKLDEWLKKHPQTHFQDNFILASRGIGLEFFEKNMYDIYKTDSFLFHSNDETIITKPLEYFDYRLKRFDENVYKSVKNNRTYDTYDYYIGLVDKMKQDDRNFSDVLRAEEISAINKLKFSNYIDYY